MAGYVRELNGVRYLTTGQVAKLLGIHQRTVVRWAEGKPTKNRTRQELLGKLRVLRDPVSRWLYFEEKCVLELRDVILGNRPVRVRR